jgi:hypothetical protein
MLHFRRSLKAVSVVLVAAFPLAAVLISRAAPAPAMDLEKALKKASVDGKYAMLLHQFKAEKDAEEHGDFEDYGYRTDMKYGDQTDLTPGHWVYVAPYWYVWEKRANTKRDSRGWGPEQATGEPNVIRLGTDNGNAWASKTPDNDDEWLLLEYDEPVVPIAINIHESFNPGAVNRVTVFKLDGAEVEVFKGADPTAVGSGSGVSEVECKVDFKTTRVKLYIDSKNVAGWNEIDAVGVKDKDKNVHWAKHATASSTYAAPYPGEDVAASYEERIEKLQAEIRKLKKTIEAQKKTIEELQKKNDRD